MNKYKLDKEEQEILKAVETGKWEPVPLNKKELEQYINAAKNTLKKDSHIHIRLSKADLEGIKTRAVKEGLPYQTLISSILHKYVTGNFVLKY